MWQEIPIESAAKEGTFRIEANPVFGFDAIPDVQTPRAWVVGSYVGRLTKWEKDYVNGYLAVEFSIDKVQGASGEWAPRYRPPSGQSVDQLEVIPFLAIAGAIAALAGLTLVYLTVNKVYELVESPAGAALSLGVVVLLILVALTFLPKVLRR